ncbi:MAG: hypothetical protein M5U07_17165 [Xanthobacteraceae bacterium]|nr:hypothetical protein [Xanthobacteraceae bacterium]
MTAINGPARMARGLAVDQRRLGQRDQPGPAVGQALMAADHEVAARPQRLGEPRQHGALQRRREVGEGDMAAENEVEPARRRLAPQVLLHEGDAFAMRRLHAEEAVLAREGGGGQGRRQLP